MIALGLAWPQLFPPESYWSPQQAKEYQDAFYAAHAAQDAVENGGLAADGAELEAARHRYLEIQSALQKARSARSRNGKYILVLGLIILLSTVVLRHFWTPAERHEAR